MLLKKKTSIPVVYWKSMPIKEQPRLESEMKCVLSVEQTPIKRVCVCQSYINVANVRDVECTWFPLENYL